MPDLRSELQKLTDLKFDDDGETMTVITLPPATAKPDTLGVSERMFNIIRDNPGRTRSDIVTLADKAGINHSSSSSLVVQFTRRQIIRPVKEGTSPSIYFTVGDKYTKGYVRREKPVKVVKPVAQATPKPAPVADNTRLTTPVPQFLETLSIVQARELYDALKKIFGG
jgi:hypothetical protein